ncbi:MAG TPA: hypothetical protein VEX38_03730, partial [Fimbriimonadaceae bacterium]|nr:hypothetical protein [Fimbriimonadaceae bacterium]
MRKWTRRGSFKVATLTLLCGALVGASCRSGSTKTPLQAPAFPTLASLKPQELKLEKSNLVLGGTKIGVEVESKLSPGVCEIILSAYDQVMETEKYTFDEKSFGVREITGEVYEPSLDLIRFPLRIGDSYKWKGKLSIGEMSRPAEAIVQTGADKLFLE